MAEAQRNLATRKTESEIAENNAQAQHYADQTGIARRKIGLEELNAQREKIPASIQATRDYEKLTPAQQAIYEKLNAPKNDKTESIEDQARKYVADATKQGERIETAKENAREIFGTDGSAASTAKTATLSEVRAAAKKEGMSEEQMIRALARRGVRIVADSGTRSVARAIR
jgi:hypothetical protein